MNTPLEPLISRFVNENGSDLYLIAGAKPCMHGQKGFFFLRDEPLTREEVIDLMKALIPSEGMEEFHSTYEYNTAIDWRGGEARLRINLYLQRQLPAMV